MGRSASPTIRDIAEKTGFSLSAVSCALSNKGNLSAKTRDLILETAKEIGYRPNLFAANLRSYRLHPTSTGWPIGLIIFYTEDGAWYPNDPMVAAMHAEAKVKGFRLLEYPIHSVKELKPILKMLYARGVYGLILPSFSQIENLEDMDWDRFSVVTCGRQDVESLFHNVRDDPFSGVIRLWKEFERRGYHRIGVAACRHPTVILDDLGREGAIAALQTRLKNVDIVPPFLGRHYDADAFLAWFAKYRPEAVIGFNDFHYYALKGAGYSIPGDCAYASLVATTLPMDTVSDVHGLIGKKTLRLMDSLIRHHETGIPEEAETLVVRSVYRLGTFLPIKPSGAEVAKKD